MGRAPLNRSEESMSPTLIFEILFIGAACIGTGADIAKKEWGKTLAFAGLIFFCIVLLIGGK
jgi:hypothetical protein